MKQRIVILGAGESGTGAALLASKKGYEIFVSDQSPIKDKYKQELLAHKIDFEEGQHTEAKIINASLIIKSPGIPDKAEIIKKCKYAGIEIIDELEFGFRFIKGKVIAITGTNGKTTTTLLTFHLLKEAGVKVALAGNVGFSLARQIAEQDHDWYVIEISSFQLDGTTTFKPAVGVLLNITPDHLDRYEYQLQNYINSKFRITRHMSDTDTFIYYADDAILKHEVKARPIAGQQLAISLSDESTPVHYDGTRMSFGFSEAFKIAQSETTLKGPHNLINTMAAVSAAQLAGLSEQAIRKGLATFKNAPHRLESVAVINGVEFVNDSKATNVDSVVYGLGSYTGPLVWIAGGVDKGNDYTLIEKEVKQKVRTLICLGKENDKLKKAFGNVVSTIKETQSVKELVKMALAEAQKGDVVLLSPACASFDLFKNYEDRGDQFRSAVLELKMEVEGQSK
ncbi:UDP-N-acetylmuramoyl-L-alanine--D-glutamate ligase [Chryseotalea sanaruensis]|uniref:UDP-N-acetylmuramoylalanine--D-glutamate ligase n=1 Tax=Chryseotalea sanaruensis TaxID=2482724 RepID=A0A401UEA6_9BACT|nr:UDP-N-acetylmuramoyl-L-alanine--D-glutamate ligase [Chryseotalea sanaruensis]GCC53200.1 UDP-N-acetylmuramoyl-L-alanine--D-glutamate ligase [Chryseotalea sanaruensis]